MIKIFKFVVIILISFSLSLTFFTHPIFAANNTTAGDTTAGDDTAGDTTGAKTVKLDNPLGTSDVSVLIGRVITGFLGIVGSLALVMVIYGGFTWMLAAGNSEKVKKGRDIIVWAAIGLVVIFTSYALVKFVIEAIE